MDFKKKLKIRLWLAISYIVIGALIIVGANMLWQDIEALWGIGLGIAVCGFARLKHYFRTAKNEETIKKQEITESDERNIEISKNARSIAFSAYLIAASIAVIVLMIMDKFYLAKPLGYSVCFLILAYWVSYFVLRKKH